MLGQSDVSVVLYPEIISISNTEVFGSTGSVGTGHFVRYSRKSVTLDILNVKFHFGDCRNERYSRKSVISESGTSENLCNRKIMPENNVKEVFRKFRISILTVTPENPLIWAFLMQNFNLGIAKLSVIPENPLFPNPVLPKTSVFVK